jgi:hypothetical protein
MILISQIGNGTAQEIANFLHQEDSNKKTKKSKLGLGRFLSDFNLKECKEIVHFFMEKFQFHQNFTSSLRFFFSHLVLENDPEKIDILLSEFSE